MTDFCQPFSLSIFSPLRCTPLSKSLRLFFIFGTLGSRGSLTPHYGNQRLLPFGRDPWFLVWGY